MSRINNYIEVQHALGKHSSMTPSEGTERVLVDNPRITRDSPKIIRVSVPRKGDTYNVIEEARKLGLQVGDVWQYDQDKNNDRVMLKLEPDSE